MVVSRTWRVAKSYLPAFGRPLLCVMTLTRVLAEKRWYGGMYRYEITEKGNMKSLLRYCVRLGETRRDFQPEAGP